MKQVLGTRFPSGYSDSCIEPHILVNPGEIALGGDDGREVVLGKRSAETRKVVARVTGRAKAFLGFRS